MSFRTISQLWSSCALRHLLHDWTRLCSICNYHTLPPHPKIQQDNSRSISSPLQGCLGYDHPWYLGHQYSGGILHSHTFVSYIYISSRVSLFNECGVSMISWNGRASRIYRRCARAVECSPCRRKSVWPPGHSLFQHGRKRHFFQGVSLSQFISLFQFAIFCFSLLKKPFSVSVA